MTSLFSFNIPDDNRGYMTQRNEPEQRMVPSLKVVSKDDSQPLKPRKMFGLAKKSVQVSDIKSLNQTLGNIKKKSKPKLRTKQNISMVENYELKEEKLAEDKELKFSRPISTLKAISQASFQMAKKSPYNKGKFQIHLIESRNVLQEGKAKTEFKKRLNMNVDESKNSESESEESSKRYKTIIEDKKQPKMLLRKPGESQLAKVNETQSSMGKLKQPATGLKMPSTLKNDASKSKLISPKWPMMFNKDD
jgi:hypothetical protein